MDLVMHIMGLMLLAALLEFCFFNWDAVFGVVGALVALLIKAVIIGGLALTITLMIPIDYSARNHPGTLWVIFL